MWLHLVANSRMDLNIGLKSFIRPVPRMVKYLHPDHPQTPVFMFETSRQHGMRKVLPTTPLIWVLSKSAALVD